MHRSQGRTRSKTRGKQKYRSLSRHTLARLSRIYSWTVSATKLSLANYTAANTFLIFTLIIINILASMVGKVGLEILQSWRFLIVDNILNRLTEKAKGFKIFNQTFPTAGIVILRWQLSDCGFCHYHLMTKSAKSLSCQPNIYYKNISNWKREEVIGLEFCYLGRIVSNRRSIKVKAVEGLQRYLFDCSWLSIKRYLSCEMLGSVVDWNFLC